MTPTDEWLDPIFREWFPEAVPPRALGTPEDKEKCYNYEQAKLAILSHFQAKELQARIAERKMLALDNYQGHTFSEGKEEDI